LAPPSGELGGGTVFAGRIEVYCAEARRRIELEPDAQRRPPDLHRSFEVVAGAQVDWGDEVAPHPDLNEHQLCPRL
jgi:hypothetical protein